MQLQSSIGCECACDALCLDQHFPVLEVTRRGIKGYAVHEWSNHAQAYQGLPLWHATEASALREREGILGLQIEADARRRDAEFYRTVRSAT